MRLNGRQYEQFVNALIEAFPTHPELTQMVRYRLDKNLNALAQGDDLEEIVFKLIQKAEAQGWIATLIASARESRPANPALIEFAQQFGLVPETLIRDERGMTPVSLTRPLLEKTIRQTNAFLDVEAWRTRLGQVESQVCRVEVTTAGGVAYGTGFLVGPDLIMTNHHVVRGAAAGESGAGRIKLRFDYKRSSDGAAINPGTVFSAAGDWLADFSPVEELDYAIIRAEGDPGAAPVGLKAAPAEPARGWIEMPSAPHDFRPNTPMLIMQHPKGGPLKLAIDTDAIIGVNQSGTRVSYRTNTEPGSSGSPCFNSAWELVALHQSGDPDFNPQYNEGVPVSLIVARLERGPLKGVLTSRRP